MTTDPYGIAVSHLTASGQAFTHRGRMRAFCFSHSSGGTGDIEFYNTASTPGGGDTPACVITIVAVATHFFPIPDPGVLFTEGCYIVLPANTSCNAFYEMN